MFKGYKFKINTTKEQEEFFSKTFGGPRLCILRGKLTEDKLFTHNPKHSKL